MNRREFGIAAGLAALIRPRPAPPTGLPTVRPQPRPIGGRVIEDRDALYLARMWDEGDSRDCRLCPEDVCDVTRIPGKCDVCLVRIDGPLPEGCSMLMAPLPPSGVRLARAALSADEDAEFDQA